MKTHFLLAVSLLLPLSACSAAPKHTFALSPDAFLLDGKPAQIRSGEMHFSRIPREYWRHRIRMAKAMGLNTIATCVFWNRHEVREGEFDFKTGNLAIAEFLRIAKEEGMWVLLRPGPYACAEHDFGGIPPYLLRHDDLKIRCMDPRYMAGAERYLRALAPVVRPYMVTHGGPVLMVQIENEYGSYPPGRDRTYLETLCRIWREEGVDVPFYTADGACNPHMTVGHVEGGALGMDPGENEHAFEFARNVGKHKVPVFCSESYPGWLTHWGEGWFSTIPKQGALNFFMSKGYSFNFYMACGGTNWGFTAGANSDRGFGAQSGLGSNYQPDVTSYDYGSPIDEQGRATPAFATYRDIIARYLPKGETIPDAPPPIPAMRIPEITLERWASLWDCLPGEPIRTDRPKTFESIGQNQGFVLYRHDGASPAGKLAMRQLHDYAVVVADGKLAGTADRRAGQNTVAVPAAQRLDLLVEGMGHINFFSYMTEDRKGITRDVSIDGTELTGWTMYPFPVRGDWIEHVPHAAGKPGANDAMPGGVFKGRFTLASTADTFFDLRGWTKGFVWVNGHNLGRYWCIGPQHRLYCPASWLKEGENEIAVLDLLQTVPSTVYGAKSHFDVVPPAWEGKKLDLAGLAPAATGTLADTAQPQTVALSRKARQVCLEAVSTHPAFTPNVVSLAEIEVLDAEGKPLPRTAAFADSEDTGQGMNRAAYAVDGNPLTFWHTQWEGAVAPLPHRLVVDLGGVKEISALRLRARADQKDGKANGRIKDYRVFVSENQMVK